MQRAFLARDRTYDGIFCRPSCPAKRPLEKNIEYYGSLKEALFAGYRPCKRCHPLAEPGSPPWVQTVLAKLDESTETRLRDADLRDLGVDPARARRWFQQHYGLTFQAYARGRRLGSALEQIRRGESLDEAALGNGYESHSGFRTAFTRAFGSAPGQSRDLPRVVVSWVETPLGPMVAGTTERGVCLLEFTDRRMLEAQLETVRRRFKAALVPGKHPLLDQLERELGEYFAGERRQFSVALDYPGSEFQRRVWDALLRIPHGATCSYEEVAETIGARGAQRAVGTANGQNRIAIVIPCHRVVKKDGRPGGYGGGAWRKHWLLQLESGGEPGVGSR
jgi:AraC family transcriptional regulator of adaptative response/methylated-DNA-[protein]-cysteine methyltransferase